MKQIFISVLMVLLCVAFVSANEYVTPAQEQGTYPSGNFNQGLATDTVASRGMIF